MEGWYHIHDITPLDNSYNHFFAFNHQNTLALKAWSSYIYLHGSSGTLVTSGSFPTPNNSLFHLALVKKGNEVTIFVNGQIKGRVTTTGANQDYRNTTFYFGRGGHETEPSDYSMRRVRISNRALYHDNFVPRY